MTIQTINIEEAMEKDPVAFQRTFDELIDELNSLRPLITSLQNQVEILEQGDGGSLAQRVLALEILTSTHTQELSNHTQELSDHTQELSVIQVEIVVERQRIDALTDSVQNHTNEIGINQVRIQDNRVELINHEARITALEQA